MLHISKKKYCPPSIFQIPMNVESICAGSQNGMPVTDDKVDEQYSKFNNFSNDEFDSDENAYYTK